jgi:hypothetical protein
MSADLHEAAVELEASGFLPESMREFFRHKPERLERFAELESEYLAALKACKPPINPRGE